MIVSGHIDDALPLLPEDGRQQVEIFIRKFNQGVDVTAARCKALADQGLRETSTPAEFAKWVQSQNDLCESVIFRVAKGADPRETVMRMLENNISTASKINNVRSLWGGHVWEWNGVEIED